MCIKLTSRHDKTITLGHKTWEIITKPLHFRKKISPWRPVYCHCAQADNFVAELLLSSRPKNLNNNFGHCSNWSPLFISLWLIEQNASLRSKKESVHSQDYEKYRTGNYGSMEYREWWQYSAKNAGSSEKGLNAVQSQDWRRYRSCIWGRDY